MARKRKFLGMWSTTRQTFGRCYRCRAAGRVALGLCQTCFARPQPKLHAGHQQIRQRPPADAAEQERRVRLYARQLEESGRLDYADPRLWDGSDVAEAA